MVEDGEYVKEEEDQSDGDNLVDDNGELHKELYAPYNGGVQLIGGIGGCCKYLGGTITSFSPYPY